MKPNAAPRSSQSNEDLDEFEIDYLEQSQQAGEQKKSPLKFYAKLGGLALAAALTASAITSKTQSVEAANPGTELDAPDEALEITPTIVINDFVPDVTITPDLAQILQVETLVQDQSDLASQANLAEAQAIAEAEQLVPVEPIIPIEPVASVEVEQSAPVELEPIAPVEPAPVWNGVTLNSENGHIDGPTGDETYYNLPMDHIVDRMHRLGVEGDYWVREDGVKMIGPYVMVAANLKTHPRGSIVETSLGPGIVCDTGSFAKNHPNRLDIATNW